MIYSLCIFDSLIHTQYISVKWSLISALLNQSQYIFIILCSQSEISLDLLGSISGSNSKFLSLGTETSIGQSDVNTCLELCQFL